VCDNECEGCGEAPGCILLELNERREEKVKGKLAGGFWPAVKRRMGEGAW
jgi:hypothetical protein